MKRRVLLGAMGAGAATLGGFALGGRGLVAPARAQSEADPMLGEMVLGDPDAPIEFIEFASFTCPHCARFHNEVLPMLKADYVDPGHVRLVYREVYYDRLGLWASMVARCAGPVRYFGVADIIYDTQREWTAGDPATVAENLRNIGRSVGLGDDELEACLTDGDFAQALVTRYEGFQEDYDIPGTPTFYINGEQHGNMSYSELREVLDGLLAEQQG